MVKFNNSWDEIMQGEFEQPYYLKLRQFLKGEYAHYTVYPDMYDIFNAQKHTPYEKVRAVIIGQDPYHEPNQAHGLCFSVKAGNPMPPSLRNIFKEIHDDIGISNESTELYPWADGGVLLLNTVLTVRRGQANSHKGRGWEIYTDHVIQKLNDRERPVVFLLWGANARSKKALITNKQHLILEAAHPSPLSANSGFFGCRHFSKCNAFLESIGSEPINWKT
ncbi:MAG: uracil-DNA glycosylase [Oscillospiraceae bacterium]|nr:uracil-DNA glycosylase [Oscillospiraceae bacterium]